MYRIEITTEYRTKITIETESMRERDELRSLLTTYFFKECNHFELLLEYVKE